MKGSVEALHMLGPVDAIPAGEGRVYRVGGVDVAVFRSRSGELFATQARCPHRGGPLADGLVGNGRVVCPFHSYIFDLVTGEPVENDCPALRTYRVSVDDGGRIRLSLAEGSGALQCAG